MMMKNIARYLTRTAIFSVLFVLNACQHIPLKDPSDGLYIVFDFVFVDGEGENAPASKSSITDIVSVMHVLLYERESHRFVQEAYLPPEGGHVDIAPGYYDLIAFGEGSEVVRTSGLSSRGDAYAYCESLGMSVKMSKTSEDGSAVQNISFPLINEPDGFVVATSENVNVPDTGQGGSQTVRIEMKVFPLVSEWTFEAVDVTGVEHIRSMNCYVTGQVPGRFMWDSHIGQDLCAIGFDVRYDEEQAVLRGKFNTFGKHPQALSNVFLNVMVQNSSGGLFQWIFDVSEQFDNPDNTDHLLRVSSAIVVPVAEGGGYTPEVDDWSAEIVTVPLN